MSVGSDRLQRPAPEPVLFVVSALVLGDLVVLGGAVLGLKGLGVLAAGLFCLFMLTRAEWAFALMALGFPILSPVAAGVDAGGAVPLGVRALALLALVWPLLKLRGAPVRRTLKNPILWITMAFAALLWFGISYSPAPDYGAKKLGGFIVTGLLYVLILTALAWKWRASEDPGKGPREFLAACWVFICLIGLAAVANAVFQFEEYDQRLRVLGISPIWLGRYMGLGLLLAPYVVRRLRWPVAVAAPAAVVLGMALLLSGSRGPLAAVVVASACAVFYQVFLTRGARRRGGEGLALVVVAVVVVAGFFLLPENIQGRLSNFGADADRPTIERLSWMGRLFFWGSALIFLPEAGPLGLGTGGFSMMIFRQDLRFYPHNLFAEVMLENGIPGVALILLLLLASWRIFRRLEVDAGARPEASLAFFLGLFAFINAMVSGDIPVNDWIWLWAGFLAALWMVRSPGVTPDSG